MDNSHLKIAAANYRIANALASINEESSQLSELKGKHETIEFQRNEIAALKAIIRRSAIEHDAIKVEMIRLQHALQREPAHASQSLASQPMTAEEIKSCNPSKMSAMRAMFERGVRAAERYHGILKK